MLPEQFENRMRQLLGEEFDAFLKSYDKKQYKALRLNPLKADRAQFLALYGEFLRPVLWEENGFYFTDDIQPGKHPYHEAGVYYIQEPSAMAPAGFLDVRPQEKVLDLCAAPGGKSTQLAGKMAGEGLLVCNEIHPARAKILSGNIERLGVRNALVTNETPQALAEAFPDYFDKILVDAPCSGEGMFRKNEEAFLQWSPENVEMCAARQDEILDCAVRMLRPGGRLVYSTCTFAPLEDEGSIARFLERHPDCSVVPVKRTEGMSEGIPAFLESEAENTVRLWPHRLEGEGHFLAVLEKKSNMPAELLEWNDRGSKRGVEGDGAREFVQFQKEFLRTEFNGTFLKFGTQLYLAPHGLPSLHKLKILRPGLHLGTLLKNRFEPSHALALALKPQEAVHTLDLQSDGNEVRQ
ncbi:MAG TPA: RsmF rRNA methyltransferase first C-terminal domain-containing protein, partial [Lachnospiraceae bacterium]|nr:RsmF rRNA methyltransferase first C-terminal domain-containing protein [Lachnospiraceae bacterium]